MEHRLRRVDQFSILAKVEEPLHLSPGDPNLKYSAKRVVVGVGWWRSYRNHT